MGPLATTLQKLLGRLTESSLGQLTRHPFTHGTAHIKWTSHHTFNVKQTSVILCKYIYNCVCIQIYIYIYILYMSRLVGLFVCCGAQGLGTICKIYSAIVIKNWIGFHEYQSISGRGFAFFAWYISWSLPHWFNPLVLTCCMHHTYTYNKLGQADI